MLEQVKLNVSVKSYLNFAAMLLSCSSFKDLTSKRLAGLLQKILWIMWLILVEILMLVRKKKSTHKRKGKANNKPTKVVKHIDPCVVYGSPVSQPRQPNPPRNGYIITLLKFIHGNTSTFMAAVLPWLRFYMVLPLRFS